MTMVNATHSLVRLGAGGGDGPVFVGTEAGYILEAKGRAVYVSGDTDVMADMKIWADIHAPDVGILCAGGHYTMNMSRAAYAASKLFRVQVRDPLPLTRPFRHWRQSADALKAALPGRAGACPRSGGETVEFVEGARRLQRALHLDSRKGDAGAERRSRSRPAPEKPMAV